MGHVSGPLGASGDIIASVWCSDLVILLISFISSDSEWTLWVLSSEILAPQDALDRTDSVHSRARRCNGLLIESQSE